MFFSLVKPASQHAQAPLPLPLPLPQPSWPADFSGLQRCLVSCQSAGVWNWALIQHVWILLQCSLNDCSQVLLQINMPSVVFEEVYRVPSLDL